jgi:hypothetical protein
MPKIPFLEIKNTAFFLCDIQEKLRKIVLDFPALVTASQKMIRISNILEVPLVVTEQYPKGLGTTVSELDISKASLRAEKTKFSMLIPEVEKFVDENKIQNVAIFGVMVF